MEIALIITFCILFSAVMVAMVHPILVKIAVIKSIVDNPNVRKLNKKPIPVLGGVGVFFGIFMTICMLCFLYDCTPLFIMIMAMLIMLFTGVADDILNLSAKRKFVLQILAVALLMANGYLIDDMHGLFGIHALPGYVAYPLTLIAGIGIINAINLIDGVDGLSSGYGMVTSAICGIFFTVHHYMAFAMLSWIIVGALFPFFVQNVFGRKFKMFIGDGGSLVLGVVFFGFVINILKADLPVTRSPYAVSFTLSVLAIPVFDTLRVMTSRILCGRSPFSPDKTHLHHLFIKMGFSHAMTTLLIICLNLTIVLLWALTVFVIPVSPTWQFVIILAACLLATMGVWYGVNCMEKHSPATYAKLQAVIHTHRIRREGIFLKVQKLLK